MVYTKNNNKMFLFPLIHIISLHQTKFEKKRKSQMRSSLIRALPLNSWYINQIRVNKRQKTS